MSEGQLVCQQDRRRTAVRACGRNGIDFIEISENQENSQQDKAPPVLAVYFLQKIAPGAFVKENFQITGGRRVHDLAVDQVIFPDQGAEEQGAVVHLLLNRMGDLSTYRLAVVKLNDAGQPTTEPPDDFDRRYAALDFSFAANCPSDLDCRTTTACAPPAHSAPSINYLAKDYASFRQLILDRLALLLPTWQERHVPDVGITLVELLAYVGDQLSYFQDAVATEAYLDTARQRISVRRHARLVDYRLHEGCNARTWVALQVTGDKVMLNPKDAYFITGYQRTGASGHTIVREEELRRTATLPYEVFEPMASAPIALYEAHNELNFYTWDDTECHLPQGARRATLRYAWQTPAATTVSYELPYGKPVSRPRKGAMPTASPDRQHLKIGDILIFEEVKGPRTGQPADADPRHRHAVRLSGVHYTTDKLYEPPVPLVEIEWGAEDALPFAFCLSAPIVPACQLASAITVARGNVIPVDHGYSVTDDGDPWEVPPPVGRVIDCVGEGQPGTPRTRPLRFTPTLARRTITHRVPWGADFPSAHAFFQQDLQQARPVIYLRQADTVTAEILHVPVANVNALLATTSATIGAWQPRPDLLSSGPEDRHFVVEVDNEGRAHLRFGNGELGQAPPPGAYLRADYRVGNGAAGNVGARTIVHVVYRREMISAVTAVSNPLPAQGGVDPQPLTEAKLLAPHAFRSQQQRAVTAADYALFAQRNPQVQNATGALRWNGSWYTAQVTIDPRDQAGDVDKLATAINQALQPYQRMGHDLMVQAAQYVPLYLSLSVCVKAHYQRAHIKAQLLDLLSNRRLANGQRGFFHADNLTFGQAIYVSPLVALAQSIQGVEQVEVTVLKRLHDMSDAEGQQVLAAGVLAIGALEIAQLDNDPAVPENGKLIITMAGGR